jgi:hypothetical protein
MLQAHITDVKIGSITIQGLMTTSGEYFIAIPQLTEIELIPPNRSLKQIESLLGIYFQSHQKLITAIHPKAVNVINLSEFIQVLKILSKRGNEFAIDLIDALIGLSLHQLFSDAFGVKFEAEDRQDWLINRQATKQSFWWMVSEIKQYLDSRKVPSSNPTSHYKNAFRVMSIGLFGKAPKLIKEELGIPKGDLNRDHFGTESLRRIDQIQRLAKANLQRDSRPMEAVQEAVKAMNFEIIDYKS